MQALANIVGRIYKNREREVDPTAIKCDLENLNHVLSGGFSKGNLYIIAGKESVGKTSFMVSLLADIIHNDNTSDRAGVIALNVSEERWMARLLSNLSEVSLNVIWTGRVLYEETKKIVKAATLPEFDKIEISSPGYMTMEQLIKICTDWVINKSVKILFIDHMKLISCDPLDNDQLRIYEIAKALKKLSVDLNVPIVTLIPIESTKRVTGLKDLRRIGAVETFADVILFINKHLKNFDDEPYGGVAYVCIEKNTTGSLDILTLRPLLHIQKFVEHEDWNSFS